MNRLKSLSPFRFPAIFFVVGVLSLAARSGALAAGPYEGNPRPLFNAIGAGEADVRLIPDNAAGGRLLIKNLTKQPMVLQIPDAFAALPEHHPMLAQVAFPGQGFPGQGFPGQGFPGQGFPVQGQGIHLGLGNGQQGGGTQALGGGNPFGPQNVGQPLGNGLFRIAPEGIKKVTVSTVCLEYGKPQPNRRVVYRLVPVDQLTQDGRIAAVCRLVARQQIDQKVGQAVAWHFANRMDWDDLRMLNARASRYTGRLRMFRHSEIERAKAMAHRIEASHEADATARGSETMVTKP